MSIAVAHLLTLDVAELKAKLAREERSSQRLTAMLMAVVERNKKLEAVAEASRKRMATWTRETYVELEQALAALDAKEGT